MQRTLGWLLTPVHLLAFGLILAVFHVAQVAALRLGYTAHKRVVDGLNGAMLASLRLMGTRIALAGAERLPAGRPLLVVANHQSLYDIPLLGWLLRAHHPKYVAKRELGRGLPSVSYNLRHGGSVLIDRGDRRGALRELARFGKRVAEHGYAAVIFPEGTRARDGVMGRFHPAGVVQLLEAMPDAALVPVAIAGTWRLTRYRVRPIPFGVSVSATVLEPVPREGVEAKQAVAEAEARLRGFLEGGQPDRGVATGAGLEGRGAR
jgi:1-acyl-sn-glycerol-3-phosphate acyltransferase